MKRSKIFLIGHMSERELELFKKDLFDYSVQLALKIKNLNFTKEEIEVVAKNSLAQVFSSYKFSEGHNLSELVKIQVIANLREEYEKTYPTKLNRVKWPDLASRVLGIGLAKSTKNNKLVEIRKMLSECSKDTLSKARYNLKGSLKPRQNTLLALLLIDTTSTHLELAKKLNVVRSTVTNDIRILYPKLLQELKAN